MSKFPQPPIAPQDATIPQVTQQTSVIESRSIFYQKAIDAQVDGSNHLTFDKSYTDMSAVDLPRGMDTIELSDGTMKPNVIGDLPASLNPYFNIRLKTNLGTNYPLSDEESAEAPRLYESITASDLISEPRGASIFSADDFLYTKNFQKLPLNRLITLRRFAHPVYDDIYSTSSQTEPDICRLLGYSDQETNKLSDILSFSCGLRWKSIDSVSESANMSGDQNGVSSNSIVGKVLKYVDPKFGNEAVRGSNALAIDPQHDENRVYGPVDSISSASIRNIGLDFTQDMELTFEYKMKSINGVNQKAAFIDILSNIIMMCTNDAKFWGGSRYWFGVQPSKYMNDLKSLSPKNFDDFIHKGSSELHKIFSSNSNGASAKETLKQLANNALNLALGKILDTLGRPGIPYMNSLLTGNPVGPWHLTIGNPLNPILAAGDLIMDSAEISFGDELGYDDFPTDIKVVIGMKHAKPRGRAEIESMFNSGKGRTYLKPKDLHNRKIKKVAKRQNHKTVSNSIADNAVDSAFGMYSKAAVAVNDSAVWSFLKTSK